MQYNGSAPAPIDPYSDAYNDPPVTDAQADRDARPRSRSRSPGRRSAGYRSPYARRAVSPPPKRPPHAPTVGSTGADPSRIDANNPQRQAPTPSNVLGVFGLSIRTQERDLDDEFSRYGHVDKVTIVYDQRVSVFTAFGASSCADTSHSLAALAGLAS